jgi:copper transport protein
MASAIPSPTFRRACGAVLGGVALAIVLGAGPWMGVAGAHASVVEVRPNAAEVLERSPRSIHIWFTEGVNARTGDVVIYDSNGDRVPTGSLRRPEPDHFALEIDGELADGSYIVTWRGVSEDTHRLQGTWTFQVGDASASPDAVQSLAGRLLSDQRADRAVSIGWAVARGIVYGSLALLVGATVFATVIWPRAGASRLTRRLLLGGWIGLVVSTIVGALLFGAYSTGGDLVDALDPDLVRDTLDTRFGVVWMIRLCLLVAAAPLLWVRFGPGRRDRPGTHRHTRPRGTRVDG